MLSRNLQKKEFPLWLSRLRTQLVIERMQAGSCSSESTPRLGTSICCKCSPEEKKEKEIAKGKAGELRREETLTGLFVCFLLFIRRGCRAQTGELQTGEGTRGEINPEVKQVFDSEDVRQWRWRGSYSFPWE